MANSNVTTLDATFKTQYLNRDMTDLTQLKFPLTAMMSRYTDWGGPALATTARGGLHIPLKYANPPGISQGNTGWTLVKSTAANTSSQIVAFELLSFSTFGFVNISNEAVYRSGGVDKAFINSKTLEIDGLFYNMSRRLEIYAFGDGTGVVAKVGNSTQQSNFATNVLTLADPETALNIQPGDRLTVSGSATGSERALGTSLTAGNSGLIVGSVDTDAGTVSVTDASGNNVNLNASDWGIPTIANGDFITHMGARGLAQQGFQAYIPFAAPSATLFNNVNRAVNPSLLAGSRHDGSSDSPLQAVLTGERKVARLGGTIEETFVAPKNYEAIVLNLASRGMVDYTKITSKANPKVGFSGVSIIGQGGEFDILPAWACPSTLAAQVGLSGWLFCSVGDTVRFDGNDGMEVLRSTDGPNIEARVASYSNYTTVDPRSNCNTLLPSSVL